MRIEIWSCDGENMALVSNVVSAVHPAKSDHDWPLQRPLKKIGAATCAIVSTCLLHDQESHCDIVHLWWWYSYTSLLTSYWTCNIASSMPNAV